MRHYKYPPEKRKADVTNLLRFLVFEKAGWYVAFFGKQIGMSPNMMSFLSSIPALIAVCLNSLGYHLVSVLMMAIYYLLDNADGHLARMTNKTSPFGSYFDDALGLAIWSFYWGSFIFSANTPLLQAAVVVLSITAEGRALFGYKFTEKRENKNIKDHGDRWVRHTRHSVWRPTNIFFQITNVGGFFFLLFPFLIWLQLETALFCYAVLFLSRYFLLALNYGLKLWKQ